MFLDVYVRRSYPVHFSGSRQGLQGDSGDDHGQVGVEQEVRDVRVRRGHSGDNIIKLFFVFANDET
jgi:hypothetical protein